MTLPTLQNSNSGSYSSCGLARGLLIALLVVLGGTEHGASAQDLAEQLRHRNHSEAVPQVLPSPAPTSASILWPSPLAAPANRVGEQRVAEHGSGLDESAKNHRISITIKDATVDTVLNQRFPARPPGLIFTGFSEC